MFRQKHRIQGAFFAKLDASRTAPSCFCKKTAFPKNVCGFLLPIPQDLFASCQGAVCPVATSDGGSAFLL